MARQVPIDSTTRRGPAPAPDHVFVRAAGRLAQYRRAPGATYEPDQAYWEENWRGIDEPSLRRTLRATDHLGVHGSFFQRHLPPGARILEAGCGTALWVRRLNCRTYRAAGLDYALKSLARSKRLVPNLPLVAGDLKKVPFGDNHFDVYLSFGVLEHFIEGPDALLKEAFRVIKPSGIILASAPYENALRRRIKGMERKEAEERGYRFHQYYYSVPELQNEIRRAGFIPVSDYHPYGVWHGISETSLVVRYLASRRLVPSIFRYALDFVPVLPRYASHMVFVAGVRP